MPSLSYPCMVLREAGELRVGEVLRRWMSTPLLVLCGEVFGDDRV